jgi:hypothetical protein
LVTRPTGSMAGGADDSKPGLAMVRLRGAGAGTGTLMVLTTLTELTTSSGVSILLPSLAA